MIQYSRSSIDYLFHRSEIKKTEHFFSKYYAQKVEIKDLNVLIDGKSFFDVPVKNKEEAYKISMRISKNND